MRYSLCLVVVGLLATSASLRAQNGNFVPGSGTLLEKVGDDFEDPNWDYIFNEPKSSEELNERQNLPLGKSTNGRWYEGAKRGQPDIVRRVETPEGGLPGSTGSMMLKSLKTGIPGSTTFKMQQEDFILNVQYRTGGSIPVSQNPSVTTRIYLPPTSEWERRTGPHFAFRVALETTKKTPRKVFFLGDKEEDEVYWPGLFICMDTKEQTRSEEDSVYFRVRANGQGGDVKGPAITEMGWWTLGIAISSNGAVHYYARPGVEDLTIDDYISTQFPYNYKAETFRSAFFNIVNMDNGRSWTSTLIVDDTYVFLGNTPSRSSAAQMARRSTNDAPTARVAQQPQSKPTGKPASTTQAQTKQTPSKQSQVRQPQSKKSTATESTSEPDMSGSISDDSAYYR